MSTQNTLEMKLNRYLADLVVEYHKIQNLHWYVKGSGFFTAHAKLEEYYDALAGQIDEVAEAILQIGGKPLGSLAAFAKNASLTEAADDFKPVNEAYETVTSDFEALLSQAKEIKRLADDEDQIAVSTLMDDSIAAYTKSLWMIRQQQMA